MGTFLGFLIIYIYIFIYLFIYLFFFFLFFSSIKFLLISFDIFWSASAIVNFHTYLIKFKQTNKDYKHKSSLNYTKIKTRHDLVPLR
jgi:hypothetical protein